MTSEVVYLGELRTTATHLRSGNTLITDAPRDNNGKGEAFSPTDTVATALASCLMTIMGIKARQMNVSMDGSSAVVTKVMAADPRRISEIHVVVKMKLDDASEKTKKILEHVALNCPVAKSLHQDLIQKISFQYV